MGRYNQLYHDDSKHLTTAKRDTASGVCGIDASKEVINDVPVSKLVDMGNQSFENLIDNGNFKDWSDGDSSAPDNWVFTGDGVDKESIEYVIKPNSCKLTRSGSTTSLYQIITDYLQYRGKNMSINAWVKCSTANCARILLTDGVSNAYSNFHSGGGDWELLSVNKEIESTNDRLRVYCKCDADGIGYFDGFILVEGDICPAFSPKPVSHIGWVSIAPFLDENTANVANKPSLVCRGLFCGYSLPEYAAGEELLFRMRVPHSWDGTTNPWFVAITSISATEDIGDKYKLQLEYEAEDILHVIPDTTAETLTDEITVADGTAFYTEIASFELDASNLVAGQNLQGRLRRVAASASSVSNEIIVWHWDTRWKYDKIGTESIQGY